MLAIKLLYIFQSLLIFIFVIAIRIIYLFLYIINLGFLTDFSNTDIFISPV